MTISTHDTHPTAVWTSTTPDWADPRTIMVKAHLYWWARACRTTLRLREALTRVSIHVIAALLGLSWRLDITVLVDAEVRATDPDRAQAAVQQVLHDPDTRVMVSTPDRWRGGWRDLCSAPVGECGQIVVEPDDIDEPSTIFAVSAVVTASAIVAARDAAIVTSDSWGDITPNVNPRPIRRLNAVDCRIRRTPVRRWRVR